MCVPFRNQALTLRRALRDRQDRANIRFRICIFSDGEDACDRPAPIPLSSTGASSFRRRVQPLHRHDGNTGEKQQNATEASRAHPVADRTGISSGLTTSSIILAKSLEEHPPQLTPQQQLEQPFTIGGNKITPKFHVDFSKSDELLFVFFIYNQGAGCRRQSRKST